MKKLLFTWLLAMASGQLTWAQQDKQETNPNRKLQQQQPGLGLAASKIFFSEKRYSISGFGEASSVHYVQEKNRNSGDLELYYSNLFRFSTFFGYRISDKIIWNSELLVEHLRDGSEEQHNEILFEAFFDFLLHKHFNLRIGYLPLPIGYVNNNDEPVMFYSVNRSEVERLIIPSTWIEPGAMIYGQITPKLRYALGLSGGMNAAELNGDTWIRQARSEKLQLNSVSFVPQVILQPQKSLELSLSGYFGNTGQGQEIILENETKETVRASLQLITAYAKYTHKHFQLLSVGAYGHLNETDKIYQLTEQVHGEGQVAGKNVYGFQLEASSDILSFTKRPLVKKLEHLQIPLFVRYERLDTHAGVDQRLTAQPFGRSNLDIWTIGFNIKPIEHLSLKTNYQFRNNRVKGSSESDIFEMGLGFIF